MQSGIISTKPALHLADQVPVRILPWRFRFDFVKSLVSERRFKDGLFLADIVGFYPDMDWT
jgi:hypothetical protein